MSTPQAGANMDRSEKNESGEGSQTEAVAALTAAAGCVGLAAAARGCSITRRKRCAANGTVRGVAPALPFGNLESL